MTRREVAGALPTLVNLSLEGFLPASKAELHNLQTELAAKDANAILQDSRINQLENRLNNVEVNFSFA